MLGSLRRIAATGARLEVVIGLDEEPDEAEIRRLQLPSLTDAHVRSTLIPRYEIAGFQVEESGILSRSQWPHLETRWAKRLRGGDRACSSWRPAPSGAASSGNCILTRPPLVSCGLRRSSRSRSPSRRAYRPHRRYERSRRRSSDLVARRWRARRDRACPGSRGEGSSPSGRVCSKDVRAATWSPPC